MKSALTFTLALILGAFALFYISSQKSSELSKAHVIGIIQTASHPALDMIKESFKEQIRKDFSEDVQFIEQNGLGQMNALQMMAKSFHQQKKIELILAIGTPAIQVMAGIEKERPLVFAAVTDPSVLQVDLENGNIYGVSDAIEASDEIQTIINFFSKTERVGLLYSSAEINSQSAALKLTQAMQEKGIKVQVIAIQSVTDIPQSLESACRKCDLILSPTDHLVATSMPLIARITNAAKRPMVASDVTLCAPGLATAAYGVDYSEMGRLSAQMAFSLIQKKAPKKHILQIEPDWVVDTESYKKLLQ
jgi:putative ABC transport system substrate-binding protein